MVTEAAEAAEAAADPLKNRHLVFISAGDLAEPALSRIAGGDRAAAGYDIAVCYYGEDADRAARYERLATPGLFWRRRGSKIQNFLATVWAGAASDAAGAASDAAYDAVALLDDDIALSPSELAELFRIHTAYQLDVSQPAFSPAGKISHDVTKARPENVLRYVNFVEMTAMVLSWSALAACLAAYDARLVGFGTDYLFLWTLGTTRMDAYAVIDAVVCLNPTEAAKYAAVGLPVGPREIDRLERAEQRRKAWIAVAGEKGIPVRWDHRVFGAVKAPPSRPPPSR